jgi:hypothetical protein
VPAKESRVADNSRFFIRFGRRKHNVHHHGSRPLIEFRNNVLQANDIRWANAIISVEPKDLFAGGSLKSFISRG